MNKYRVYLSPNDDNYTDVEADFHKLQSGVLVLYVGKSGSATEKAVFIQISGFELL